MPKSPTKPSTPRLSDLARHVRLPAGVASTGWPAVQAKCRDLGITFRPWQPDVGRIVLAKREDGKYAATIGGTGLSIPRQVGKTFLVGAIIFALCLLRPNLTVIWTAHRTRTAEETFKKMQAFAKRKKIAPHIAGVIRGSGEEAITFRNGSRILFGARESEFGRGFDEVDVLIFDEAQILTDNALDAMVPATNQSRQPTGALLLFMGTPPKPPKSSAVDRGEVFTRMRTEVLGGDDPDTGWVEFGADEDFEPTPLPDPLGDADWEQVAKANPSFPADTPPESILRMRKKLGTESFLREGLGIWDDPTKRVDVFGRGHWSACRGDLPDGLQVAALAVAPTRDLSHSSIVAAGADEDFVHVKPLQHGPGTGWVVDRAKELQDRYGVDVVVDGGGPASVLVPHLERAGVRVRALKSGEALDACAEFYTLVRERRLRHAGYAELDDAVVDAIRHTAGKRWAWRPKASTGADISPLEAATFAAWAVASPTPEAPPPEIF
jgi:hypothetical protein